MITERSNRLLMEGLEVVPKGASDEELFQTWGRITRDPEVQRLTGVDAPRIKRTGEPPHLKVEFIHEKSVADIVVAMTLEERRALRDRIMEYACPR